MSQGLIIRLLLFIIYTNDFPSSVQASNSGLFADDANILVLLAGKNDSDLQENVTTDMQQVRLLSNYYHATDEVII